MGETSLLTEPFLDDDEDVRRVQRFAGAGARTGAKLGAIGGPVGAGIGAGFGSATGYLLGYGLVGVDPAARLGDGEELTDDHEHGDNGADSHSGPARDHEPDGGHHGHDDGPIMIDVTDED